MILIEGGNEFKYPDGTNATKQNASTDDVQSAVRALGKELGIDLMKHLAGSAIYPNAETGDGDTILDPRDYLKVDNRTQEPKEIQNQLRAWLAKKLQNAGYVELPKKSPVTEPGKFYKISGDGLTACVQIPGSEEWFQIDLDIAEPGKGKFTQWSKRGEPNEPGMPKDARAKGAYRHILKTEIAKAINPDWMWSYKAGLVSRSTGGAVIPDSDPQDPDAISKALFGGKASAADLDNINAILAKFKLSHPDKYNDVVAKVNDGLVKYKTQYRLKESYAPGSREWFRQLMDSFK
jgi:hypothetical protein